MEVSLAAIDLSYSYVPGRPVLRDISISLEAGEITFILGGNGSGKTTLIQCLCGIRDSKSGSVEIDGKDLKSISPIDRARLIGFVPQIHEPIFAYSVFQVAMMGRAPYLGQFSRPQETDREHVAQSLKALNLWDLRDRAYTTLSGGEQRLALIARGLTQGARYLLMDEPDAHLDPRYQHEVFTRIADLADDGFMLAISSHSPNNALLYGRSVVILAEGQVVAQGLPEKILTPEMLRRAYGMDFQAITDKSGLRAILPRNVRIPYL